MKLPHQIKPCNNCPFRNDGKAIKLNAERITDICKQDSFTCHKTNKTLQCAGHMIFMKNNNAFYRVAKFMKIPTPLRGKKFIFKTLKQLIDYHAK